MNFYLSNTEDHWNWEVCKEKISGLKGRLGFPNINFLEFLGLSLNLKDGSLFDTLTGEEIKGEKIKSKWIIQSVFYLLSGYANSNNVKLTGELITSSNIRGNKFLQRPNINSKNRLIKEFSNNPYELAIAANVLGGTIRDFPYGDVAIVLMALPRVPVTIILSESNEEYPSDVRIYYDKSIKDVFDSEQTNFLTTLTTSRLIDAHRSLVNTNT